MNYGSRRQATRCAFKEAVTRRTIFFFWHTAVQLESVVYEGAGKGKGADLLALLN